MSQTPEQIREANYAVLENHDFRCAKWLPMMPAPGSSAEAGELSGTLRPVEEIARQYLAMFSVFAWASAPPDYEEVTVEFIDREDLRPVIPAEGLAIIDTPKMQALEQYQGMVGWRLENMWPLAWLLGLTPPPSAVTGQLPEEITGMMIGPFMPDLEPTTDSLVSSASVPAIEDVCALNDLFYCAHNAVRGAQISEDGSGVPIGFHPIADGGAIHERRHSLMWALSPGATWDGIELHT